MDTDMKNARFALAAALLLSLQFAAQSQTYRTALGVRVDHSLGISLQQYVGNKWTLEVIGHAPFRTQELGVTALAEKHRKLLVRNLNFYYGFGGHYYWKSAASQNEDLVRERVFGLSGIGGLELSLGRLNVAVDYKPELHLAGDQNHPFEWHGAAVSVRYIIEKRSRNKIFDWPRNRRNRR